MRRINIGTYKVTEELFVTSLNAPIVPIFSVPELYLYMTNNLIGAEMSKKIYGTRNCPECNELITYSWRQSYEKAIKSNTKCNRCAIQPKRKEKRAPFPEGTWKEGGKFHRDCPNCNETISYTYKMNMIYAEEKKSVCSKCTPLTEGYKKGHQKVKDRMLRMWENGEWYGIHYGREYEKYLDTLPEWKAYKKRVWRVTRKQPIQTLENYDRRGHHMNDEDAYHLDHKYSVRKGFENNIDPEIIGNINNLEFIHWKKNVMKRDNCSISITELRINE